MPFVENLFVSDSRMIPQELSVKHLEKFLRFFRFLVCPGRNQVKELSSELLE